MTQEIRFYHLTQTAKPKALALILRKAIERDMRAVVIAEDDAELKLYDDTMWTFSAKKPVPHGTCNDDYAHMQPVYITTSHENPAGAELLCLPIASSNEQSAPFMEGFSTVLYLFDGHSETETSKARDLWKYYKQHASPIYYRQSDDGSWEKV